MSASRHGTMHIGTRFNKRMRIYLDDERTTPDGWVRVYWPDEAIALLRQHGKISG